MATLVYAPEVEVHISTADGKVIDVTADIQRTSLTRVTGGVSSFSVDLLNQSRKYDGMFSPMDRVVVYMRRIRRMLVFSGYLNSVPLFSAKPTSIHLDASCTLKRLQNFLWDPKSTAAVALFAKDKSPNLKSITDGGMAKRTISLLHDVAGWPTAQVHIGAVPSKWFDVVKDVADRLAKEAEVLDMITSVGAAGYTSGKTPLDKGQTAIPGAGPGTGVLPDFQGKISGFGGPSGGAYGSMALSGESGSHPRDPWYCAMRFPYQEYRNGQIMPVRGVNVPKAAAWWRNRRLLAVNPETGKAVCVRAADWGPAIRTGRVLDLSPKACDYLGGTDATVHIAFAPEGMALGIVKTGTASQQLGGVLKNTGVATPQTKATTKVAGAGSGRVDWGNPDSAGYSSRNIVSVKAAGITFQVNKHAAARFVGFVNELVSKHGYKPRVIGGFNNRNIAGSRRKSNHAYGAAIDIDPAQNPRVTGTARHTIPDNIVATAYRWGLGWGGSWRSSKDYMHFEVIDGPSSPTNSTYKGHSPHYEIEAGGFIADSGDTTAAGAGSTDPAAVDPAVLTANALFNVFQWIGSANFGGTLLSGIRALMNDEPIMNTVQTYMAAALREFTSAPNGDFIAWFPDYFGFWGTAGKLIIRDIELVNSFSVGWSDENLKTHVFVTSSSTGVEGFGDASAIFHQLGTSGIASVEFPEMMKAFFNAHPDLYKNNGRDFLNRFGPRVYTEAMDNISGPRQEFFFACMRFMQNWAQQFSARVEITFMPEAYPGMLLVLPQYGVQAYIREVQHNTDSDSGFTTNVFCEAWSQIGNAKAVIKGLPKGAPL